MKSATVKSRSRTRMKLSRVLIADADAEVRHELGEQLRNADRDVLAVADGLSAIALAGEPSIELLVVDLLLPQASGLRVIGAFRRARGTSVRIVLMSAIDSDEIRSLAYAEGADQVLTKPLFLGEIVPRDASLMETIPELTIVS